MVASISDRERNKAIHLRVEERLGLDEIVNRTGISQGALSKILRDYPLTSQEVNDRKTTAARQSNHRRKYTPTLSKLAQLIAGRKLTTIQKGQIAEDAVRLRLRALGYEILVPPENSRADLVITRFDSDRLVRLQVKWARRERWGRPYVNLRNSDGAKIRRVSRKTCDLVIGYDVETDTAYVMPISVCEGTNTKSCDERYAEAWHLVDI